MINLVSPNDELFELIAVAGYNLKRLDNEWITTHETEVQAIINAHDPVPYERTQAKARITAQANAVMQSLEDAYPEFEKKTWPYQKLESEAYALDPNAATPTIDAIATGRGKDRVTHILATQVKVAEYHATSTALIGERQRLEDLIDAETDWQVIQDINFEVV